MKEDYASICSVLEGNPDYYFVNGIPRQKRIYSSTQEQTKQTFAFKWKKRDTYESDAVSDSARTWLQERYAIPGVTFQDLIKDKTILDAGCGSGFSSLLLFGDSLNQCRYIGADVSSAVDVASQRFAERGIKGEFLQVDLMNLPEELGSFDIIFSEGVLHHTDSTEKAIRTLAKRIRGGGYFLFYVYNKKGPIREFTDDLIRERLSDLTDEQTWERLMPLSKLGKLLGDLEIEIDKLEEMNHVNFDWYRPQNCHRQTPEEVRSWVETSGLEICKMDVQEAGITVVARKP